MDVLTPFRLLEVNLISAQDLEAVVRRGMETYAVAWVNPKRKLTTRIDTEGHTNPTWNDKFIFRVDDEFLSYNTSAVMVEIYAVHWFRDIHIGTVRIIIGNLINPNSLLSGHQRCEVELGMRFVALQVWRPSGRPQGILNIGLTLLDGSRRSMPLYMGSSAVGYQYFMGEDDPIQSSNRSNHNPLSNIESAKPGLRRTMSDSSSMLGSQYVPRISIKGSSIFDGGEDDGTERNYYKIKSRGSSMVNYTSQKSNNKGKSSSMINGSGFKVNSPSLGELTFSRLDHMAPRTDSCLGPSPSEVAAAVAKLRNQNMDDAESSLVGSWSLDQSMEGLGSKLERWRLELPPVYDCDTGGASSSYTPSQDKASTPSNKKTKHGRRRTSHGGLFSCFGNICGYDISIKCGGPGGGGGGANASKKRRICTKPLHGVA